MVWAVSLGLLSSLALAARADIRLPKIFSDHMVVQRQQPITIWGWADPNESIRASLHDVSAESVADEDGFWQIELAPLAAGGPYELKVAGAEASVLINQVHVGEVWLCSGQSNMEWPLKRTLVGETDEARQAELEQFRNSRIRLFNVAHVTAEKPAEDLANATTWQEASPESAANFSAVAYHFAAQILQQLDAGGAENQELVIGLIDSSWGGTAVEAWTPRPALQADPQFKPLLEHWKGNGEANPNRPGSLYNGMIAPLQRFSIRGTIWYQGEANVGRGHQYLALFKTLIKSWREKFGESMPFYFVQLAPYRYAGRPPEALAELRDAQLKVLKQMSHTGMAVTTDVGNLEDIHPRNKKEVGRRLALWALAKVYGRDELVYSGPIYESAEAKDGAMLVTFSCVGEGLTSSDGELDWFSIAGEDGKFVPAQAVIVDRKTVKVYSPDVPSPKYVRFAWNDSAQPNLRNQEGLPASPFRTDDLELQSNGIKF